MALITKLNPPQIGSTIPAFYGSNLRVPFILNKTVSEAEISSMSIMIKTVSTNILLNTFKTNQYFYDYDQHCYVALFNIPADLLLVGQYYKIQVACVDKSDVVGYYSTVGVVKYTSKPKVEIRNRDGIISNTYEYTGLYSQSLDTTEKVYTYCFNLYDNTNTLIATSGVQLHNNSTDTESNQSTDTWTIRKNLDPNLRYSIEYIVTTSNGLTEASSRYEIVEVQYEDPSVHADLSAKVCPEDGYVKVSLLGKKDNSFVNGYFILLRASSENNYDSWYELTRFQLQRWDSNSDMVLCKDHTVSQGFSYKYAIQAYNSLGTYSNRMLNREGNVVCDFEDAFLWDGERQLKIRFNPKVSSFKSTVLETKTDTIGGKYPFIFRNGNVEYKEFQISGLLSLLSDENDEFLTGLYDSGNQPRNDTSAAAGFVADSGHWLSADNYRKERQFKLEALAWLTNGKPKLFRSAAEGNYIVRLMNVSLSPNDTLGRMLHTFNCTAYEIADCTFDNLRAYGFTVPSYVETRTLQVGQIRLDNIPSNMQGSNSNTVILPQAYYASITDAIGVSMIATYKDGSTDNLYINGTYVFPESALRDNPLIELSSNNWGQAKLVYAYYDTALDSFSFIHKISTSDKIIQIIGTTGINYIQELEDVRLKTGAFHYIRVQPRSAKTIYLRNGEYYYNHSGDIVNALNETFIYIIVDVETGESKGYLDGRYGREKVFPMDELTYNFRMSGSDYADFSVSNQPATSGRYEALTNISSLTDLYADNGVLLDIVYQENELLYAVEVVDSGYEDTKVLAAKQAWLVAKNAYEGGLASNALNIDELKSNMDTAYQAYISLLEISLNTLKEEHNVDFAI